MSLWAKINFCRSTAYKHAIKDVIISFYLTQTAISSFNQLETSKQKYLKNEQNKQELYLPPILTLTNCIQTFIHIFWHFPARIHNFSSIMHLNQLKKASIQKINSYHFQT